MNSSRAPEPCPGWYPVIARADGQLTLAELDWNGDWWIIGCGDPLKTSELEYIHPFPITPFVEMLSLEIAKKVHERLAPDMVRANPRKPHLTLVK